MSFLLDTNVVSEWVKPRPNRGMLSWLNECDEDRIFVSVVTVAELRHGVERLPSGARRNRLHDWLSEELPTRFEGRLLGVDAHVANIWGLFMTLMQASGRSINVMDACIAAIAKHHRLTLVTRNVRDFEMLKIAVVNPWTPT